MKVPLLQIVVMGDISPWARQFLNSLEEKSLITISPESSVDLFCRETVPTTKPFVVFLENNVESKKTIEKLCQCGKSVYLVMLGKSFSKEDVISALEKRVYCVIESSAKDESWVTETLKKLSGLVESNNQFQQILRAIKGVLLQTEAEFPDIPMVAELRTAVKRLESYGLNNELNHLSLNQANQANDPIFHKTQTLGESILTVNDLSRTGTLWVKGQLSEEEGRIEFLHGRIIEATAGGTDGVKAILRMFLWDAPRLLFNRKDPKEITSNKNVELDITQIVKKGSLIKERFEKIRKEIPPKSFRLEIVPGAISQYLALEAADFLTLSSIVEFGSTTNILDFTLLSDLEIYESLINLRKNSLIRKAS
jgi:hypothetical protein